MTLKITLKISTLPLNLKKAGYEPALKKINYLAFKYSVTTYFNVFLSFF